MNAHSPQPSPDDLDRAFSQFFRAQVPAKWPAAPIPADAAPARAAGSWRVRLTLAASVAAMLAFGLAVSYGPTVGQPTKPNGGFDQPPEANGGKLNKLLKDPPMEMMP